VLFTASGPFEPLISYAKSSGIGRSTQANVALALGLFIDYMQAHGWMSTPAHRHLALQAFAQALYQGTIDVDGCDASGLYWQPMTRTRAIVLVEALCMFLDWLVLMRGTLLSRGRPAFSSHDNDCASTL
jgi:hypothetical protein